MAITRVVSLLDRDDVFRRNPKIDTAVVAAHERLERELKRLGVEIKPSYGIEPPFGQRPTRIHNHSRLTTSRADHRRS